MGIQPYNWPDMDLEKNPRTRKLVKKLLAVEDRIKGKPFPGMARTSQKSVYSCGPATIEMLFSNVGLKVKQGSLVRSIRAQNKIKAYGVNVKDLAKASKIAAKGEFVFWHKNNSKISDLDRIINKYNYPVGVEWQGVFYENEDEDSGHYGVITRLDRKEGTLRIADPYFNGFFDFEGVDRKFKIKDFVKKWWDTNDVKIGNSTRTRNIKDVHMMFVITRRGENWPGKLGMKKD